MRQHLRAAFLPTLVVGVLSATLTGSVRAQVSAASMDDALQASTLTFRPTDDSYVRLDSPNSTFGSATSIQVDNSPVKQALLKFTLTGIGSETVTSATLRLYAVDSSGAGGDVHRTASAAWSESSVTWNTAPAADPATVASMGSVAAGTWYEIDVIPLVTGDGAVSIRVTSSSSDGADFASKERGPDFAPQLVITAGDPPTNTVPPTISGLPVEGEVATAAPGSWEGTPPLSFAFQWRRCDIEGAECADIPGETGETYRLASADVLQTVRVTVSATNGAGSSSAGSAAHGPVAPGSDPPPPPPPGQVVFGAAGDLGAANDDAGKTLDAVKASAAEFFVLLGDVSYSEVVPESAWCSWAFSHLGAGFPLQLISGNHEEDGGPDGRILEFAKCAPDRMSSTGTYAAEYFFDRGPVRVIPIAADLTVGGVRYDYAAGNSHSTWLRDRIREAKAAGKWVVVAMHEVCLTAGNKPCSIGDALQDLLIAERVDLVLQGHDHDYQRFHSLRCANPGVYEAACVADSGVDGAYARNAGTVFLIAGTGGRSPTAINTADAEYPYVATWMGYQTYEGGGNGFVKLTASAAELRGEFVNATNPTGYTDSFIIAG